MLRTGLRPKLDIFYITLFKICRVKRSIPAKLSAGRVKIRTIVIRASSEG
jgi:hypothetical protein